MGLLGQAGPLQPLAGGVPNPRVQQKLTTPIHTHTPAHPQIQGLFGPELWRSAGWRRRFSAGVSLVLACHPDQATEPAL